MIIKIYHLKCVSYFTALLIQIPKHKGKYIKMFNFSKSHITNSIVLNFCYTQHVSPILRLLFSIHSHVMLQEHHAMHDIWYTVEYQKPGICISIMSLLPCCPQIQGAILVSSLLQIVLGFSGLVGLVLEIYRPAGYRSHHQPHRPVTVHWSWEEVWRVTGE